jgi:hypothetical protein
MNNNDPIQPSLLSFSSVVGAGNAPDRRTAFQPGQNDFPALGMGGQPAQQNHIPLLPQQQPSNTAIAPPPPQQQQPQLSSSDPYSLYGLIDIIRLTDHDSAMVSLGYVIVSRVLL